MIYSYTHKTELPPIGSQVSYNNTPFIVLGHKLDRTANKWIINLVGETENGERQLMTISRIWNRKRVVE